MTNFKLRSKLLIQNLILITFVTSLIIFALLQIQNQYQYDEANDKIHILKEIISKNIISMIEFDDIPSIEIMFNTLKDIKNIEFMTVYRTNGEEIAFLHKENFTKFREKNASFFSKLDIEFSLEAPDIFLSYSKISSELESEPLGYLLIGYSKRDIKKAKREAISVAVILAFVAIVLAVVSLYFLNKMIVTPINQLQGFFKEMAAGKGDLSNRLKVQTNDEFKELAEDFNHFLDSMKNMIINIQDVSYTVDKKVSLVEELAKKNDDLVVDLSKILDSIMENTRALDNGARLNVSSAEKATEQSENTISLSISGKKALEHSIGEMEEIKSEVVQLEKGMTGLHERSKEIQMISNTLQDIADKTSILAINTSIEANKAGDLGLGFLVIADEIHELSEQSANSLSNIYNLTRDIQGSLDESYHLTVSCSKRVEEGTVNIENTGQQISTSVDNVQSNMNYVEEVLRMAKDQREMVQKIYQYIVTSSQNLSTIRRSVTNTLNNVQEQKVLMSRLTNTIKNIKV